MSASLPSFVFGSGESFDDVRDCLPPRLLALAAKGPALLGLPAPVVAVAGLAHLAASFGRSCLLDDGISPIPACFNLAVVSDSTLPFDWLSILGRGWVDCATRLQTLDPETVQEVIRNAVQSAAAKGPERSRINPQLEAYAEKIPMSVVNMLRRRCIASSVSPKTILRGVVDSRDLCVALFNGATDPMLEWSLLTPSQQKEFAEILILGWQGKPLTVTAKGTEVPGMVHVFWLTHPQSVRKALFGRGASTNRTAPILLFGHSGNPKRLPDSNAPELAEWKRCLESAFQFRHRVVENDFMIPAMDDAARQVAEEFYAQCNEAIEPAPPCQHPYLRWLPELPLRLYAALLMAQVIEELLQAVPTEPPKPDPSAQRDAMAKAVRLTRWLAQEHYRVLCRFTSETTADTLPTDNTDIEQLEEGILQRLRNNGPQTPRELQRSFHQTSAKERDNALQKLKIQGRVIETEDGKLDLAA